ncbi:MAG: GUN4 domain-containing protein [Rhizonema sp. PD37]|nr:GUN4 domain-containing protein [Rhizonema sp. PD37]
MQKILVLAANPIGTSKLRLDEELREIQEALRRARKREQFELLSVPAVRYRDIQRAFSDNKPQIVHFSGHGSGEKGLVFEDETGQEKFIDAQALSELFELFVEDVKCVLLNACFSEIQANVIAQHIDYVIGMSQEIGDKAAIEFAVGFYDALGGGESVERAYKLGCNAIRMAGIPEHLTPKLLLKKQLKTIGSNINIPVSSNVALDFRFNTFLKSLTDDLSSERGIDYTRLRNFLALDKWFDADKETLNVMLKVTQREKEGWLDVQSINDIPCIDLHTIDQLWVKYSNGRFGFSVQQRIWKSVGGKLGVYNDEVWINFGERLGWRTTRYHQILFASWTTREWSYYSKINFNQDAQEGHLPRMWDEWRGGLEVSALTLKIENCEIKYEPQKTLPNVEIKTSISRSSSEKEVNYTRLENFLASGNWKYADQETRLIMLNIAQREKEGWLDINSISNFKSTDLCTINQLWMKYSDGHFGFSIQKSIWQDVENNEQAFSYKVGWRILGKSVYHHSLTFSLDALPGHLPFWGRGWCGEGQWVQEVQIGQWAKALLSHQDL